MAPEVIDCMANDKMIGLRIREARKRAGLRQDELGAQIGIGKSSISEWESGKRSPDIDKIEDIAKVLKVSAAYLMGWEEKNLTSSPPTIKRISDMEPQRIRLIGEVAAGEPILAEEDYEVYIDVDAPVKADYALTVRGDSMEPTYLDGDVIYIRERPDVDDGQIAVVLIDDSATLKYVYHQKDGVLLVSENPKYPPMHRTFGECDCIKILGIVVGYTRMYA